MVNTGEQHYTHLRFDVTVGGYQRTVATKPLCVGTGPTQRTTQQTTLGPDKTFKCVHFLKHQLVRSDGDLLGVPIDQDTSVSIPGVQPGALQHIILYSVHVLDMGFLQNGMYLV